ncbi:MAG: ferritin-like domain-containing protein [Deltaproteobacteria bacterium]|nr:ferritin-like domain-containing protein [Deltaproteobacteria bacterium]
MTPTPRSSFAHATLLRRNFRNVLVGAVILPLPIAIFAACSAGAGIAATDLANGGSGDAETCRALSIPDAGACATFEVTVTKACELDASSFSLPSDQCAELCGRATFCNVVSGEAQRVRCGSGCPVDGRRYDRLDDRGAPSAETVGAYLARMAFFEAASVDAFACLAAELAAHGAPASLVRSCRRARLDEIRHAQMAEAIAQRHGASVDRTPPAPSEAAPRSLEAIAIENAIEGCVRETFGVVVGMWQAEHAPSADMRAFFSALVDDELRHAALSARIDAWLLSRLSPAARARVEAARSTALDALGESLVASEPLEGLGLPSRAQAAALFAAFRASLACAARAA